MQTGNIFSKDLPKKYENYADERSDLIPMIRILCECFQNDSMNPSNISPTFGVNFSKELPIYEYMNCFINNVYKKDKNVSEKQNAKRIFKKLHGFVEKILVKNNILYDFIQQLLISIKENAPEFINIRHALFIKKQVNNGIFTNVFEGNDSTIYIQQ